MGTLLHLLTAVVGTKRHFAALIDLMPGIEGAAGHGLRVSAA